MVVESRRLDSDERGHSVGVPLIPPPLLDPSHPSTTSTVPIAFLNCLPSLIDMYRKHSGLTSSRKCRGHKSSGNICPRHAGDSRSGRSSSLSKKRKKRSQQRIRSCPSCRGQSTDEKLTETLNIVSECGRCSIERVEWCDVGFDAGSWICDFEVFPCRQMANGNRQVQLCCPQLARVEYRRSDYQSRAWAAKLFRLC